MPDGEASYLHTFKAKTHKKNAASSFESETERGNYQHTNTNTNFTYSVSKHTDDVYKQVKS